ncbi:MAG: signal peptidase I [Chloroflexota bacterium]|nr:signal peptidase I [Chloroflexota bacterium]
MRTWYAAPGIALVVALAVLAWLAFAPAGLGGRDAYVITSGVSMQPRFHTGDLAIVRRASHYQVGEIVAYHDPAIGRILHRIIARDGDRFVMKGDNNSFIDAYHPTSAEIVGRLWLHVPAAGRVLVALRQPAWAAAAATLSMLLFAAPIAGERRRRGARTTHRHAGAGVAVLGPAGQVAAVALCLVALAGAALAVVAFRRGSTHTALVPVAYEQKGAFSYTAPAPGVYASGQAATGQPVFPALASRVDLTFAYQINSVLPVIAKGSYQVDAVVRGQDGWTRTLPLVPPTPFSADHFQTSAVLDLKQLLDLINVTQERTGVQQRRVSVAIAPSVNVAGTVGGAPLKETFAPDLGFVFDPGELQVDRSQPQGANPYGSDPFAPKTSGTARQSRVVASQLSLAGLRIGVGAARRLAEAGLALAAIGAVAFFVLLRRAAGADEPARIRAKYGALLVSLRASGLADSARVVDVSTFEDLVRIADRSDRMILHQQRGAMREYFLADAEVTYRYTAGPVRGGEEVP